MNWAEVFAKTVKVLLEINTFANNVGTTPVRIERTPPGNRIPRVTIFDSGGTRSHRAAVVVDR
jgi:hypothetical protein